MTSTPPAFRALRHRATLARSWALLTSFPDEQRHPDRFYSNLASDTADVIELLWEGTTGGSLAGTTVLDVGGGPGYFGREFGRRGVRYIGCEPDLRELHAAGLPLEQQVRGLTVQGSGMDLPFASDAVDVVYSSNVVEHVPEPWRMCDEMVRVCRPGGLIVVSYTPWYGPFGGHEMGLTHYLGGERARRLYEWRHGHPPKNYFGRSLFAVGCREGMEWARLQPDAEVVGFFPRYHPGWAWWMVNVPGFREVAVSNLVTVLRKREVS